MAANIGSRIYILPTILAIKLAIKEIGTIMASNTGNITSNRGTNTVPIVAAIPKNALLIFSTCPCISFCLENCAAWDSSWSLSILEISNPCEIASSAIFRCSDVNEFNFSCAFNCLLISSTLIPAALAICCCVK